MIKKTVFSVISLPKYTQNILQFSIFIPESKNIKKLQQFFDFF